jgi:branched-chain amino acid transport system substrate-binding protein
MKRLRIATVALALLLIGGFTQAQITVGVDVGATGPAASIGIPAKNAILVAPAVIAGQKIRYVILDDGSDPTAAVQNVKRLLTQDNIDVLIGPSATPTALAVVEPMAAAKTPMIAFGSSVRIVSPMDADRKWAFKTSPNDSLFLNAAIHHMVKSGIKTLAIVAMDDALGEGWTTLTNQLAPTKGIKVVAVEKFQRTDTSTTAQALHVMQVNPDAVLIVAAGTPALTPQLSLVQRGYKGKIYQSTAGTPEFIRVGGKAVEGTFIPAVPVIVADQLPKGYPTKETALHFIGLYNEKYGAGTANGFAGHAWDAIRLLEESIPIALKKAKPGTPEFRTALRDALEKSVEVHGVSAVFNMSPTDHSGMDERGMVIVKVENGTWKLADYPKF